MDFSLEGDLARLERLAFKRRVKTEALLRAIHRAMTNSVSENERTHLGTIRSWLVVPYTLWPVDFASLGEHVVRLYREERPFPADLGFTLERIQSLPSVEEQNSVAKYEHLVERGRYEEWLHSKARKKFHGERRKLLSDPAFKRDWVELKRLFQKDEPRLGHGILRRTLVQERNFRINWEFLPDDRQRRFQVAFDAFCHRWRLYGMEGEKPLLLKLSVNLTAHGTMIVLPAFWSFDHQRDLQWDAIMELHKARGVQRQGPKLSSSRIVTEQFCRKAARLWKHSEKMDLSGQARLQWTLGELKRDSRTDSGTLRRWIRRGKALIAKEKGSA